VMNASIIIACTPAAVSIASAAVGHERLPLAHWLGTALSFAGVGPRTSVITGTPPASAVVALALTLAVAALLPAVLTVVPAGGVEPKLLGLPDALGTPEPLGLDVFGTALVGAPDCPMPGCAGAAGCVVLAAGSSWSTPGRAQEPSNSTAR